jgi:hypothetical protein
LAAGGTLRQAIDEQVEQKLEALVGVGVGEVVGDCPRSGVSAGG